MKSVDKKINVDEMGVIFAKAMVIFSIIGIILIVVPSIGYFLGYRQYLPQSEVISHWSEPVAKFWIDIKTVQPHGYSWIFKNLNYTDTFSMIGVMVLLFTPFFSIIAAMFKTPAKIYKILLAISAVEFILSIVLKMN